MLSPDRETRVQQHLELASGFLETAIVRRGGTEFEQRNALSRAYYAMFHACSAWLAAKYGITGKLKHFELLDEMHRRRGKEFGDFVRDIRGLRRRADYSEDWKPQPLIVRDRLEKVKLKVLELRQEVEAVLRRS